jgi:hypothetical protein
MTDSQGVLFESDIPNNRAREVQRWLFATNQRNLLYMLAAGLIMPPKGFGDKYYQDTLDCFRGWIPLFADRIPAGVVEYSVAERSHLIPCLATVNLSSLRGDVIALGSSGEKREIIFPDELDGSEDVLLIPAPLPITWINEIFFRSGDEKKGCETDARDFGNVPLLNFKRKVHKRQFSDLTGFVWPPSNMSLPDRDLPMDGPFAAGAMMAMFTHLANLGDIGVQMARQAFDGKNDSEEEIPEPMIAGIGAWITTGRAPDTEDFLQNLFWSAVERLIAWRSSDRNDSPLDVMLDHLSLAAGGLDDNKGAVLLELVDNLRRLATLPDRTNTEVFERFPRLISRVMTLFFLREECAELLEFRHPLLDESVYMASAILFAAREGWLGLSMELRDYPGLQEAVPHRMAALAHRSAGSGVDLGPAPARPIPVREYFAPGSRGWNSHQREAAVKLARECQWPGIQTRVSLGKGDYRLEIDGRGMHILIPGEAKAVISEVDVNQFFENLARRRLTNKQEKMICKLFGG